MTDPPVTAAVAPYRIPSGHVGGGRFARRGDVGQAIVEVVRGLAASALARDQPDGIDLDVRPDSPVAVKLPGRVRARWHSDTHALVNANGHRVLVPWSAFHEPAPGANDAPDRLVGDVIESGASFVAASRRMFNLDLGGGYRTEIVGSALISEPNRVGFRVDGLLSYGDKEAGAFGREVFRVRASDGTLGPVVVEHKFLEIEPQYRGNGVGTRFLGKSIAAYREAGVDRITTTAASSPDYDRNGAYTWARAGFQWTRANDARAIGDRMVEADPTNQIGKALLDGRLGDPGYPTPNDVALDPVGREVLLGPVQWRGVYRLTPDTPAAPAPNDRAAVTADDLEAALTALDRRHLALSGPNTLRTATLPVVAHGERWADRPLPPDTQRWAIHQMFLPGPGRHPAPILDAVAATADQPPTVIAVNPATGEIIGWHSPNPNVPPGWVSAPADHPAAAALVTAAWAASPDTVDHYQRAVLPALRQGRDPLDTLPAVTQAARARSDAIAHMHTGDVRVRLAHDADGSHFVPDPAGNFTIDGADIRFADFSADGKVRLWADPDLAAPAARPPYADIDYTDADDPTLPWVDRVAALAKARGDMQRALGTSDLSTLLAVPTEADAELLVAGIGGDREFEHLAAIERFGESLDALVEARRLELTGQPDRKVVLDKIADLGVPDGLVDFLARTDWDSRPVSLVPASNDAPDGGGSLTITFPDFPDSRITMYTSPRTRETMIGWEFSAQHQMARGNDFAEFPPSGMARTPASKAPGDWYESLDYIDPANPPAMQAWIDTMEALGIDMGTDDSIFVAAGRDIVAEDQFDAGRGAVPIRLSDLPDDDPIARVAYGGLRPFPRSWTETLGEQLNRVVVRDDHRTAGSSRVVGDVGVVEVADPANDGRLITVSTHEWTHLMERTVNGLMHGETWHFIRRLRDEAARTGGLAAWDWGNGFFGYQDDFGDVYMGRIYTNMFTGVTGITAMSGHEILSTVSETLWSTLRPVDLDPQARRLLLAFMSLLEPTADGRWVPRT